MIGMIYLGFHIIFSISLVHLQQVPSLKASYSLRHQLVHRIIGKADCENGLVVEMV